MERLSMENPSYYYDVIPYTSYFYYRMLTRRMYEPIHQNLLDYQTEQMKSTADSMGSSFGGFSGGGAGGGGGGSR